MGRILVVDDLSHRHLAFDKLLGSKHQLVHAWSVNEAWAILREARFPFFKIVKKPDGTRDVIEPEPTDWHSIYLDHDNDMKHGDGRSYIELVWAIVGDPRIFVNKPKFIVHSANPEGAQNMHTLLTNAGFEATLEPFDDYYWFDKLKDTCYSPSTLDERRGE